MRLLNPEMIDSYDNFSQEDLKKILIHRLERIKRHENSKKLIEYHISKETVPSALFYKNFPKPLFDKNPNYIKGRDEIIAKTQAQMMDYDVVFITGELVELNSEVDKIKIALAKHFKEDLSFNNYVKSINIKVDKELKTDYDKSFQKACNIKTVTTYLEKFNSSKFKSNDFIDINTNRNNKSKSAPVSLRNSISENCSTQTQVRFNSNKNNNNKNNNKRKPMSNNIKIQTNSKAACNNDNNIAISSHQNNFNNNQTSNNNNNNNHLTNNYNNNQMNFNNNKSTSLNKRNNNNYNHNNNRNISSNRLMNENRNTPAKNCVNTYQSRFLNARFNNQSSLANNSNSITSYNNHFESPYSYTRDHSYNNQFVPLQQRQNFQSANHFSSRR